MPIGCVELEHQCYRFRRCWWEKERRLCVLVPRQSLVQREQKGKMRNERTNERAHYIFIAYCVCGTELAISSRCMLSLGRSLLQHSLPTSTTFLSRAPHNAIFHSIRWTSYLTFLYIIFDLRRHNDDEEKETVTVHYNKCNLTKSCVCCVWIFVV